MMEYDGVPIWYAALSDSAAFQATYWHNRLYNDAMPAGVQVLSFSPDWARASGHRDS